MDEQSGRYGDDKLKKNRKAKLEMECVGNDGIRQRCDENYRDGRDTFIEEAGELKIEDLDERG